MSLFPGSAFFPLHSIITRIVCYEPNASSLPWCLTQSIPRKPVNVERSSIFLSSIGTPNSLEILSILDMFTACFFKSGFPLVGGFITRYLVVHLPLPLYIHFIARYYYKCSNKISRSHHYAVLHWQGHSQEFTKGVLNSVYVFSVDKHSSPKTMLSYF